MVVAFVAALIRLNLLRSGHQFSGWSPEPVSQWNQTEAKSLGALDAAPDALHLTSTELIRNLHAIYHL